MTAEEPTPPTAPQENAQPSPPPGQPTQAHQEQAVGSGSTQEDPTSLKARTRAIVTDAQDAQEVRRRVRETVVSAMRQEDGPGNYLDAGRQVMAGAVEGLEQTTDAAQRDQTLQGVIGGLQDAFDAGAKATREVLEEAAERGERFAKEDLDRISQEFREVGQRFVEVAGEAVSLARSGLSQQTAWAREQAQQAVENIRPNLESVWQQASQNPTKLAGESAQNLRRQAGALFGAVGGLLQAAGERLMQPPPPSESDQAASPRHGQSTQSQTTHQQGSAEASADEVRHDEPSQPAPPVRPLDPPDEQQ
jgi:hypothetical protein